MLLDRLLCRCVYPAARRCGKEASEVLRRLSVAASSLHNRIPLPYRSSAPAYGNHPCNVLCCIHRSVNDAPRSHARSIHKGVVVLVQISARRLHMSRSACTSTHPINGPQPVWNDADSSHELCSEHSRAAAAAALGSGDETPVDVHRVRHRQRQLLALECTASHTAKDKGAYAPHMCPASVRGPLSDPLPLPWMTSAGPAIHLSRSRRLCHHRVELFCSMGNERRESR